MERKMLDMTPREKVRILAKSRSWSQADLSRESGLSPTTVNSWWKGKSQPDRANLIILARTFGVPVEQLADDAIDVTPYVPPAKGQDYLHDLVDRAAARVGVDAVVGVLLPLATGVNPPADDLTTEAGPGLSTDPPAARPRPAKPGRTG
jgi:transcriptional regulator with XRE-family HTH domain